MAHGVSAGTLGAVLFCSAMGVADATPVQPGCTAADLAGVSATAASETETYLRAHPDVNEFFTGLQSEQGGNVQQQVQDYMNAHPQTHADLQRIRQPRTDLMSTCHWSDDALAG